MDPTGYGSNQLWILPDMDPTGCGSNQFWIRPDTDPIEYGSDLYRCASVFHAGSIFGWIPIWQI